jgi:hypothetical protein
MSILIENGNDLQGMKQFEPGTSLTGRVDLMLDGDINCRSLEVWVEWHTHGRGDRDTGKFQPLVLHEGKLLRSSSSYFPFTLALPHEPWSYAGHYINILWLVMAKIDIPRASDINAEVPFVLRPALKPVQASVDPFAKQEEDPFGYDPFADN